MEKNIKDYLPFYLGAVVACHIPELHVNATGILWQISSYGCRIGGYEAMFPLSDVKPHLRPLSDMTHEEVKEQRKEWYSALTNKPNDAFRQYAIVTKFLLSKHFDLFGLIEAGLAIDKTKI